MADLRLERVEERVTWLERHVVEQDKVVLGLSEQLQRLKSELAVLRERTATREQSPGGDDAPADERPPHY